MVMLPYCNLLSSCRAPIAPQHRRSNRQAPRGSRRPPGLLASRHILEGHATLRSCLCSRQAGLGKASPLSLEIRHGRNRQLERACLCLLRLDSLLALIQPGLVFSCRVPPHIAIAARIHANLHSVSPSSHTNSCTCFTRGMPSKPAQRLSSAAINGSWIAQRFSG